MCSPISAATLASGFWCSYTFKRHKRQTTNGPARAKMNIEALRDLCRRLPAVTEDVKWGHDLCFSVAGKMFCVAALDGPLSVSFKVKDDEFDELSNSPGFRPAPYVARYKWVLVEDVNNLSRKEWAHYIKQSYDLVKARLPQSVARKHGLA